MGKYVCLRDDDTSFFTKPSELIEGYGEYWGSVPLTLATVPFAHGSQIKILDYDSDPNKFASLRKWEMQANAKELTEYHQLYPIGANEELIDELKKQLNIGMIEIAQHGVSHRYNQYGAETLAFQVTYSSIRDGMEYLNKVFETKVMTYIPPSNTIDKTCAGYIDKLGMRLFVSGGIKHINYAEKMLGYLWDPKAVVDKIKHKGQIPIKRRDGVYMISSYTYDTFKEQDAMFEKISNSLIKTGFAALGTHYMLLNENGFNGEHKDYRNRYLGLINRIQMIKGVEFVTAKKFYELLMEKYYG